MHRKTLLISLLFIVCQTGFSQPKLPVLLSDSTSVRIKIDGNVVAEWYIDENTKPWTEPDVFSIERSFKERKVVYLSNRDSLSFNVKPGERYNFFIRIKNRGSFPMGLATFGEPVFQHRSVLISVFGLILFLSWLAYAKRKEIKTLPLLYLGIISPLFFWLITITGGCIHGHYNHLHNVVSELGAIGTRSETFMSATETLMFILTAFSVIGFYRACKGLKLNVIPVLTILALAVSMLWAAIFPMHHELHGALGPLPIMTNAGVLLAMILWKREKFQGLWMVSLVSFILMLLILLRILPGLRGNWEGLIQRLYYLGWSVWSVGLSVIFIRKQFRTAAPR